MNSAGMTTRPARICRNDVPSAAPCQPLVADLRPLREAGTPIGMSGAYCSGRSLGDAVDEDVKHLGSVVGIDGSVGENYVEVKGGTEHPNRGHGVDAVA